jgi:hypothetical protein
MTGQKSGMYEYSKSPTVGRQPHKNPSLFPFRAMAIVASGAACQSSSFVHWSFIAVLLLIFIALAVPPAPALATSAATATVAAAFTSVPGRTRPRSSIAAVTTVGHTRRRAVLAMDDDDDCYADVDLSNFDVDAVIAAHQHHQQQAAAASSSSRAAASATASGVATTALDDTQETTLSSPLKRRKVSVSPATAATTTSATGSLQKTLQDTFGYSDFRPGQLSVLQHLIFEKQDVAVYWATGQGKSLCYQIPALHLDQVVVVVSPLISLMQDQCHKLNGLGLNGGEQNDIAAFLGSAQTDANIEREALQGKFNILYVTPEKMTQVNFLDELGRLHSSPSTRRKICLIAVDEAHCVRYIKSFPRLGLLK